MNGVTQLLPEHRFTRIARHLEQEETRVTLRKEVISRIVLVQNLNVTISVKSTKRRRQRNYDINGTCRTKSRPLKSARVLGKRVLPQTKRRKSDLST